MKKILALFFLIISFQAMAQERFLQVCNYPLPFGVEYENDIRWLKYFFKTSDCEELKTHISKLKSFNEFIVPGHLNQKRPYHWSFDFPHMTGLTARYSLENMPWSKIGFVPNEHNVFKHPELYSEFSNLTLLDMTIPSNFYISDVCKVKSILPHIETLMVDYGQIAHIEKYCLNDPTLPWLIAATLNGKNSTKLHSKIIGIKYFAGSLKNLKKFRFLRYLGVNNSTSDNDVSFLGKNLNLTHLSLSMDFHVKNISELKQLKNLKTLIITCIEKSYDEFYGDPYETQCESNYLTDLSFLAELPWLEKLIIPGNKLEDVSVISKLTKLKHLDLSNNYIKEMPDLSGLKELKFFDISKNPVAP